MSDDSSSSSDDSILKGSPIAFAKKDARAKRADKQKMAFLDDCLNGTNARADVHRRIADVNNSVKAESSSGGGADENGEVLTKNENDESRTEEGGDYPGDETKTYNHGGPQSQIKQESDDSWWARVEEFSAKNSSTKKPSGGRRRNDDFGSDSETDDEELWKNGGGMTRDQKRGEAAAKLTGDQSALGLRRVFRSHNRDHSRTTNGGGERNLRFYVFQSRDEALDDLTSVLDKLNQKYKSSDSIPEKLLYQYFIRPLSNLIKTSKQNLWGRGMQSIYKFLDRNPVISGDLHIEIKCECNPNCLLLVPDLFIQWMWNITCSTLQSTALESKCCQILTKFARNEPIRQKNQCSFDIEKNILKQFRMGDLSTCLINSFGLWMGPDSVDPANEKENKDDSDEVPEVVDINSLKRLFMLWSSMLESDYVLLDINSEDDGVYEGATQDLVALARVCLDPHLELATQQYHTSGDNMLLDTIQRVISSLVDSAARQITNKFDKKHVDKWLESTSIAIIKSCNTFSAGEEDAADSNDKDGHLPLAAVVSNMQCRDDGLTSNIVSYECSLIRVYLAENALKVCLAGIEEWDSEMKAIINSRCEQWGDGKENGSHLKSFADRALNAVITSEIAFRWIDDNKEDLLMNLPLLLASVYIAGECAMAGGRIFFRSSAPSNIHDLKTDRFVKYSIEEKDVICETLSNIQDFSDSLRAECGRRSVISFPHLRRAKEHLTRLTKCIEGMKGKSSKEKRQKRRAQGSLDVFLKSSQDEYSQSPYD